MLGTENVAVKVPVAVVVTVIMMVSSYFTVTLLLVPKLEPVTVTVEPGAELVGESEIDGDTVLLTVNVALPVLPVSSLTDTM